MPDRVEELLAIATQADLVRLLQASNRGLGTKAAAAYLNRSVRCLEEWRKRGVGPKCTKVRGRVIYRPADLDAYLDHGDQRPNDDAVS